MKWMRGYGTRLVWNSVMSTLSAPSKRSDAVAEEAVQVRVRRALDVEVATANVIKGLIVDLVRDIGVLEEGVHAQHRVVRLDARRGDLRARPHRERDLRLLAVVDGETLEEQAAETGAGATPAGVEDHEAL